MNETELDALLRQALIDARLQDAQSALCELGGAPVLYSDRYRIRERALLQGRIYDGAPAPREAVPAKKPRRLRRTLLVAAIIIAVMGAALVTVNAVNPKWWQAVIHWGGETFWFEPIKTDEESTPPDVSVENPVVLPPDASCYELWLLLREDNIALPLVPAWIPDGYEQTECKAYRDPEINFSVYSAYYASGDDFVQLAVIRCAPEDRSNVYEKDADAPRDIYTAGGIQHYMTTNAGSKLTVWRNGTFECFINTTLPAETVKQMIDSIYKEASL